MVRNFFAALIGVAVLAGLAVISLPNPAQAR
jgi:hypothetical protein